ncbi:hypothetical protein J14TS2_19040 [Bacillus sp. J14TS2]|nr:hypothetical protein J14TS2_19040 [Bacillus sp. J14TS2]
MGHCKQNFFYFLSIYTCCREYMFGILYITYKCGEVTIMKKKVGEKFTSETEILVNDQGGVVHLTV